MKSNYVIQAEINIAKYPEWSFERKYAELKEAYEKENIRCHWVGDKIFIIPTDEHKPIKVVYEGEQI